MPLITHLAFAMKHVYMSKSAYQKGLPPVLGINFCHIASLAPWTWFKFGYELASCVQGEASLFTPTSDTNTSGLASSPSVYVEHVVSSKVWYFLHLSNDTWPSKTTLSPHVWLHVDIFHWFIDSWLISRVEISCLSTRTNNPKPKQHGCLQSGTSQNVQHLVAAHRFPCSFFLREMLQKVLLLLPLLHRPNPLLALWGLVPWDISGHES